MKKRILILFLLISTLALPFSSCQRYSTPSATDISAEERAELGIDENVKAFKVHKFSLLSFGVILFHPLDNIVKNAAKEGIKIDEPLSIVVLDKDSEFYNSGWDEIQAAVFEPEEFLSARLGKDNIKVNRILCYYGRYYSSLDGEAHDSYGIYYDTKKGKYVYLFYEETSKHYFMSWKEFEKQFDAIYEKTYGLIGESERGRAEKFYSEYEITP